MANFYRKDGNTKVLFLPAWAGSNPTAPEIAAGTDLTPYIADWAGFTLSNTRIQVPVLSSSFTPTIGGPDEAADSSLTFNEDDTTNPPMTTLARGTAGFILHAVRGLGTGKKGEKYPIISIGVNRVLSMGNEPAKYIIELGITSAPNQNVTLP